MLPKWSPCLIAFLVLFPSYALAQAGVLSPSNEAADMITLFGALGVQATAAIQIVTVLSTLLYVGSHLWARFVKAPEVTAPVWWLRTYKFFNGLFANYGNCTNLVPAPTVAAVKAAKDMGLLSIVLLGLLTLGLANCAASKPAATLIPRNLDQTLYEANTAFYAQLTLLANYGQLPLCSSATYAACADGPALIQADSYMHDAYKVFLTMTADYQAYKMAGSKISEAQILADVDQVTEMTMEFAAKVALVKKGDGRP